MLLANTSANWYVHISTLSLATYHIDISIKRLTSRSHRMFTTCLPHEEVEGTSLELSKKAVSTFVSVTQPDILQETLWPSSVLVWVLEIRFIIQKQLSFLALQATPFVSFYQ